MMTVRRFWGRLPSPPRCKWCTRPFAGPGGAVMRAIGLGPWPKNPHYCTGCYKVLRRSHGGAEVDCSLLFADVRGSTTMAETMTPREFNRVMGRFYDLATDVLVVRDAIVDPMVGDEIVAFFVPAMAGEQHAKRAIDAALEILTRTGHGSGQTPWLPVGAGVNTGRAFVGAIGEGADTELRALGDSVNTTARLASAAAAGEVLVTLSAAANADLAIHSAEHRDLALKGKSEPVEVVVLGPARP